MSSIRRLQINRQAAKTMRQNALKVKFRIQKDGATLKKCFETGHGRAVEKTETNNGWGRFRPDLSILIKLI